LEKIEFSQQQFTKARALQEPDNSKQISKMSLRRSARLASKTNTVMNLAETTQVFTPGHEVLERVAKRREHRRSIVLQAARVMNDLYHIATTTTIGMEQRVANLRVFFDRLLVDKDSHASLAATWRLRRELIYWADKYCEDNPHDILLKHYQRRLKLLFNRLKHHSDYEPVPTQ
jgi:hypothetical protein